MTADEPGRYRFAPLERRGVLAGVRSGQLVAVAGSLVVAVLALHAARSPAVGAAVAGVCAAVGALAAWAPVRGRTPEQWAPVVLSWAGRRLLGLERHVEAICLAGTQVGSLACRGPLARCELVVPPVGLGGRRIAVVRDRASGTYVGVLAVRASGFALVGGDEQRRRVDAWASVLSGLAREGTLVHRVQWVLRAASGDGDDLFDHLASARSRSAPSAAIESYRELIEGAGPATQRHEVFLALAVHQRRAGAAGDEGGPPAILARELQGLEAALASTDVRSDGPLGPRALSRLLRDMADPAVPKGEAHGACDGDGERPVHEMTPATLMAGDAGWSAYRSDGAYHATYWIAEWPRVDVGPEFLMPLLLGAHQRRTVAMVLEPVPARRAAREAEAARTAHMADDELRRRGGFLTSARRRREQEEVLAREAELAGGHALFRYSGNATASARSQDELVSACSELEASAARAHLDLRRLYGQQGEAFTWTLPLARGLA